MSHPQRTTGKSSILAKYKRMGWLNDSYTTAPLGRRDGMVVLRGVELFENEENLRTTLLFEWLRGDLGPIDDPVVTTEHVEDTWMSLHGNRSFGSAVVRRFFVSKELAFWKDLKPFRIYGPRPYPKLLENSK